MAQHLWPEPDPSKPLQSPTEVIRAQPGEAGSETDLAQLAARFAVHGGGTVSPELSTDLALEVVLNEIVEQACLATGATGAAIVLWRDGELVCRASSGATAPELGSRLDPASGISGQCIRTYLTRRCDDVLSDPQADQEASLRLGIRSVLVMPLLRRDNLLGIFELFSSRPKAFGERDERTLEALVTRTLTNLNRATQPLPPPVQPDPETQSIHIAAVPAKSEAKIERDRDSDKDDDKDRGRDLAAAPRGGSGGPDFLTLMLGAAVLVCAVMLGVLVGRHFAFQRAARARLMTSAAAANSSPAAPSPNPASDVTISPAGADVVQPAPSGKPAASVAPAGGLQVYENGKEIFSVPPGRPASRRPATVKPQAIHAQPAAKTPLQRASTVEPPKAKSAPGDHASSEPAGSEAPSPDPATIEAQHVVELPTAEVDNNLLSRVEPEYPANARQQKVQGDVVLQVHIGTDGAVEGVDVVSGPEQLVQSSADAVRQWRFKPRVQNGEAVRMQTRVTLNFRLPS